MRSPIRPAAAVLVLLSAGVAQAQDAPPARNGNVYDNTAHEPDAGATTSREKASGVAPSPQRQQSENNTVEQLDQQILQRAQTGTGAAAGCSADRKACPQR